MTEALLRTIDSLLVMAACETAVKGLMTRGDRSAASVVAADLARRGVVAFGAAGLDLQIEGHAPHEVIAMQTRLAAEVGVNLSSAWDTARLALACPRV